MFKYDEAIYKRALETICQEAAKVDPLIGNDILDLASTGRIYDAYCKRYGLPAHELHYMGLLDLKDAFLFAIEQFGKGNPFKPLETPVHRRLCMGKDLPTDFIDVAVHVLAATKDGEITLVRIADTSHVCFGGFMYVDSANILTGKAQRAISVDD